MPVRADGPDVMDTLVAMRPDAADLGQIWNPERREVVLARVHREASMEPGRHRASRWIGAGLAVAAVSAAALLLVPGMLGAGRPIPAVPAESPRQPVTVPTWVRVADSPLSPRFEARGVWVDGQYLLVSGHNDPCGPVESDCSPDPVWLSDGAMYDPDTDAWTLIALAPLVGSLGEPVVLGDSVYFLTDPAEILDVQAIGDRTLLRYQVDTDTWTSHPLPQPGGGRLVATDSAVIVAAGSDLDGEVDDLAFHPDTGTWTTLPDDPLGASHDRWMVWAGDRLVLSTTRLEADPNPPSEPLQIATLDTSLTNWTTLVTSRPVYGWEPLAVGDRVVWKSPGERYEIIGDRRTHEYYSSLDPATSEVTDIKAGFERGTLLGTWAAIGDQTILEGDLFDPVTGQWTAIPALEELRTFPYTTQIGGDHSLLLWGGNPPGTSTDGRLLLLP